MIDDFVIYHYGTCVVSDAELQKINSPYSEKYNYISIVDDSIYVSSKISITSHEDIAFIKFPLNKQFIEELKILIRTVENNDELEYLNGGE